MTSDVPKIKHELYQINWLLFREKEMQMRCLTALLMLTMLLAGCERSDGNKSTSADQHDGKMCEITLIAEVDAPGINVDLYCDHAVAASGVTRDSTVPHDADKLPPANQPTYVTTLRTPIKQGTHVLRIKAVGYTEWQRPLEVVGDHHFEVKLIKEGPLALERD